MGITYDKLMLSTGVGDMSTRTGKFTCEQTGTYLISWSLQTNLNSGDCNDIYLYRNGSRVEESMHDSDNDGGNYRIWEQGGRTMLMSLNDEDTIWLQTATFRGSAECIWFNVQLLS